MSESHTQRSPSSAHRIGLRGEAVATAAARARGWTVEAQRLRTPAGEADIFATRPLPRSYPAPRNGEASEASERIGLVIEVKTAEGRWPSTDLVDRRRQARLWRVADFLGQERDLVELEVVIALVRLEHDRDSLRWIATEAW